MSIDNEGPSEEDLGLDPAEVEVKPDKHAEYTEARARRVAEGQALLRAAIDKMKGESSLMQRVAAKMKGESSPDLERWLAQADGEPVKVNAHEEPATESVIITGDGSDLEIEIIETANGIVALVNPEVSQDEAGKAFWEGSYAHGYPEYNMVLEDGPNDPDEVTLRPGMLVSRSGILPLERVGFQRLLTVVEAPLEGVSDNGFETYGSIKLPDRTDLSFPAHFEQTHEEWDQEKSGVAKRAVNQAELHEITQSDQERLPGEN